MRNYGFFLLVYLMVGIFAPSSALSQEDLTNKLLKFQPPLKPEKKPIPSVQEEMSEKELLKYAEIFAFQKEAKWDTADIIIKTLEDRLLLGYVMRDRYLHPAYNSTYSELSSWMASYADHAGAGRIYSLALAKADGDTSALTSPKTVKITHRYIDITRRSKALYEDGDDRTESQVAAFDGLFVDIRSKIREERPTQAMALLNEKRAHLSALDYDRLRGRIAASYMHEGYFDKAFILAERSVGRSGAKAPLSAWVAGLSAWRMGRFSDSARYFEVAAGSEYTNAWTRSGAAFWASRAHMRMGDFQAVSLWLNRAASEPRTFYGLIALRALSRSLPFEWHVDSLTQSQKIILLRDPAAARAFSLAALGRYKDAEGELRFVEKSSDVDVRRAIIPLALQIKAAGMAWRSASYLLLNKEDDVPLAAQYPQIRWQGDIDHRVDPALLHAIIRQESRFNPRAGNLSGASGLMQMLPSTARGILGDDVFEGAGGDSALYDPDFNVNAGQKYVHELFKRYVPNRNLFDLMIAWNAGPGNLRRWKSNLKSINDPLLFIETIPVAETRAFIERVMTNYWMYQNQFGRKTPSLDAVAEGKWPIYVDQSDQ